MNKNKTIDYFKQNYPLIKFFELDNCIYLYDGKSSLLVELEKSHLKSIYNYYNNIEPDLIFEDLKRLLEKGIFLPGPLKKIVPSKNEIKEIIQEQVDSNIPRKLILEVTEKCTLRCKYCFYTNDHPKKRKHSGENMQEDIAYKAIDHYYKQYTKIINSIKPEFRRETIKKAPPHLFWWGGEPFANFDLIITTKEYFESLDWEKYDIFKKDLLYTVATNLTIYNKSIETFIIENNIHLLVSLDGDQEAHNKNRIFVDGTGSFKKVINSLDKILKDYPEYAKNNIVLQPVWAENIDIGNAQNFIVEYFQLDKNSKTILASMPSLQRKEKMFLSANNFIHSLDKYILDFRNQLTTLNFKSEKELKELFTVNKTLYTDFQMIFMLENILIFDKPLSTDLYSRTFSCPLGVDSIFVSINGDIHCCCKVDQSFPIGNVYTGINWTVLEKTYNSYFEKIDKKCKACWAFLFCKICPALVCWNGDFILPSEEECSQIRLQTELLFIKYIMMIQEFEDLYSILSSFYDRSNDYRFDSTPITIKEISNEKT